MKLRLVHLYPELMNIYGDYGNVLCLQQRAAWRKIDLEIIPVTIGEELPKKFDVLFMGGGQDRGQELVAADLYQKGPQLKTMIEAGLPALLICGAYQLFGHYFMTAEGKRLVGIGIFNASTTAGSKRLIGNVVLQSERFGNLVGFENHSGLTTLAQSAQPLGIIRKGYGNDDSSRREGIVYKAAIGTYLHWSGWSKNPY